MSENDKSLEDFFAKKSKKKGGKGKGKKFTTSDEIAKKLVEQDTTASTGTAWTAPVEVTSKKPKEVGKDEQNADADINYRFQASTSVLARKS